MQEISISSKLTIGVLKIYEKTPEEYFAFIPPGGLEDWHKYRDYRIRFSETIGPESPLVRRTFDGINGLNGRPDFVRAMSGSAVSMLMSRKWLAMGLPSGKREFKMCHGFRSLFRTRIKTAGIIDKEDAEHMTGHKDPYFKPEFSDTDSDEFNGLLMKFARCYHKVELSRAFQAERVATKAVEEKMEMESKVMDKLRLLELENEKYRRENNERMARNEKALKEALGQNLT